MALLDLQAMDTGTEERNRKRPSSNSKSHHGGGGFSTLSVLLC
ncbi:SapB/AmfS family lanthipeptide [Streptomyces sp. KR80]